MFLYGDESSELNHIELPRYVFVNQYMKATHAVETTHNTYIVSHCSTFIEDREQSRIHSVSEVDVNGRVFRTFNNNNIDSIQFNYPCYLAVVDNSHVIVADLRNECVVLLDSNLQFKRVLISSTQGQPKSV